ncbi:STAS domain-containing protein [Streptomyces sp. NPDC096079]|uniref:STAS domain-containing protein n=1 Tax=unclassified Streptomyces TaxID=2593676 RepID=UPI00331F31BA
MVTGAAHTGRNVVRVSGEMDLEHAEQLRVSLMEAVTRAPAGSDVVVDLRNSSFCDSSGLNVLLAARQRALDAGRHLVLAAPSHQMIRLLEFTRTYGLFSYGPVAAD